MYLRLVMASAGLHSTHKSTSSAKVVKSDGLDASSNTMGPVLKGGTVQGLRTYSDEALLQLAPCPFLQLHLLHSNCSALLKLWHPLPNFLRKSRPAVRSVTKLVLNVQQLRFMSVALLTETSELWTSTTSTSMT